MLLDILRLNERLAAELEDLAEDQRGKALFSGVTNELADLLQRLSKHAEQQKQVKQADHAPELQNRSESLMSEMFAQMSGLQFKTAKKLIQRFKVCVPKADKQAQADFDKDVREVREAAALEQLIGEKEALEQAIAGMKQTAAALSRENQELNIKHA